MTHRDCARAWEAMPWVLQHGASAEETERLASHLAECKSCCIEYEQQRRLCQAMQLPASVSVDANAGLKHLLDRLDTHNAETLLVPNRTRKGRWLTRALIAAVLVQAVGICILGIKLSKQPAAYHTLSQPTPIFSSTDAIRVVPDADIKMAEWNAVVRTFHLQVIAGPNDVGAYTVIAIDRLRSRATILQQLRATQGIRLAEPVAETP